MSIASRVKWFLDVHRVPYEVIVHPYADTAAGTAKAAGIPSSKLAKAVLLEDERGYLMPVLPASKRLDLDKVRRQLCRDLELVTLEDLGMLFFDCDDGAIPPMGSAYGIPTVIDDELLGIDDIYLEGGDHVDLIHMNGNDFHALIPDAPHADLSC